MLVLVPQCLTGSQLTRVKVLPHRLGPLMRTILHLIDTFQRPFHIRHLAVMRQQLLEILGPKDANLCKQQLALHERRRSIVQHRPHWHQVLELATRLLHHAVLTLQHNRHATQVRDLCVAHDQTVDVEAARGENA